MKTISASIVMIVLLAASLVGWQRLTDAGDYIVGGQRVIHRGEVIHGDLHAFFAQVTLEEGAQLEGGIVSISSALDIGGNVSGDILAVCSDTIVRSTAELLQAPRAVDVIPYVILLPPMARLEGSASIAR